MTDKPVEAGSLIVAALEVLTVKAPEWQATVAEVAAGAGVHIGDVLRFADVEPLRGVLLAAVTVALDVALDEAIEVVEAVRHTPVPRDGTAVAQGPALDPDLAARAAAVSEAGPDVVYLEWFVARQFAEE